VVYHALFLHTCAAKGLVHETDRLRNGIPTGSSRTRIIYGDTQGCKILDNNENTQDYVLRIIKNLYGQKKAGRVWYQYLAAGLEEMGFTKSKIDECVFYYKNCLVLIYVDDSIIMGPVKSQVQKIVKRILEQFKIQEEGDMCEFIGIELQRKTDGSLMLRQPQLIDSILKDLRMDNGNVGRHLR
jgi:hypothetical protein